MTAFSKRSDEVLRGEQVADDVVDAVVAEVVAHRLELLEHAGQHFALARVLRDEVEDAHVVLLAEAVDAAHALLEAVRVPRDVVVDHQAAELQVDPLTGRLRRHHDLRALRVAECVLLLAAGVLIHAAVDLRDVEPPRLQVLGEVIRACRGSR